MEKAYVLLVSHGYLGYADSRPIPTIAGVTAIKEKAEAWAKGEDISLEQLRTNVGKKLLRSKRLYWFEETHIY